MHFAPDFLTPALALRLTAGFLLSALIACTARWKHALSPGGAIAAIAVATACAAAGWSWASILIAFFASSTILSKIGESVKQSRTSDVVEKGGERDAWQVLANGGVFAMIAVASLASPAGFWQVLGAGAIAASAADTWATETGTLIGGAPRSILSWKPVATGTSGGVTARGTLGGLLGAGFIAIAALLLGWSTAAACAALVGGFGGSLIDSLLGASLQATRWCERCARGTERAVHSCGTRTVHAKGLVWMGNDMVNLLSSIGGALLGVVCLV